MSTPAELAAVVRENFAHVENGTIIVPDPETDGGHAALDALLAECETAQKQRDACMEAAATERPPDAVFNKVTQDALGAAEARARRYEEALREIDAWRLRRVTVWTEAYGAVCEIARAALAEDI